MTYTFHLLEQPWIPCIDRDGLMREYSLTETLYQAHKLHGVVADSPLETAAIYRMLLAVLHSALRGPTSRADWAKLWQAESWDSGWLKDYLQKWRHRFDLFDPQHPFYQARDERVREKSIISLVVDMASGNNAVLFDHHTEEEGAVLGAAKAARTVLVAQTFGLAGLSGLEQKFTDSPWSRGIIFLVEGETLFETLALNMLIITRQDPIARMGDDLPAWEMDDPYSPERQVPLGYLDYLTWQNRRVLLKPEGPPELPVVRYITVAPGLRQDPSTLDPMKHYRKDEKFGYLVLRFLESRALWRDHAALLAFGSQNFRPPQNFLWTATLADEDYISRPESLRFMALGMANDQAKVEFMRHEHTAIPQAYLKDDTLVEKLATALSYADQTNRGLRDAVNWLGLLIIAPNTMGKRWKDINRVSKDQAYKLSDHWGVERVFWGQLESQYLHFLNALPSQPEAALAAWVETLQKTAWQALEHAAGLAGESAVALRAAVQARGNLGWSLNEIFNPTKEVTA